MDVIADKMLETLLDLHGTYFVVDDLLGLWVKFEAWRVNLSAERPHGVRYSLTLHNKYNERLLGFDNAYPVEYGRKNFVSAKWSYDHYHAHEKDRGRPYQYLDAAHLLEHFWQAVDEKVSELREKTL